MVLGKLTQSERPCPLVQIREEVLVNVSLILTALMVHMKKQQFKADVRNLSDVRNLKLARISLLLRTFFCASLKQRILQLLYLGAEINENGMPKCHHFRT